MQTKTKRVVKRFQLISYSIEIAISAANTSRGDSNMYTAPLLWLISSSVVLPLIPVVISVEFSLTIPVETAAKVAVVAILAVVLAAVVTGVAAVSVVAVVAVGAVVAVSAVVDCLRCNALDVSCSLCEGTTALPPEGEIIMVVSVAMNSGTFCITNTVLQILLP